MVSVLANQATVDVNVAVVVAVSSLVIVLLSAHVERFSNLPYAVLLRNIFMDSCNSNYLFLAIKTHHVLI